MVGYEVLGTERRRRWSVSEKDRIVIEAFSAAEGVPSVARRHGVYPQQIYRWRRDLAAEVTVPSAAVSFLPVSLTCEAETAVSSPAIESVHLEIGCVGGRSLRIDGAMSDTRLQHLIRLVETA